MSHAFSDTCWVFVLDGSLLDTSGNFFLQILLSFSLTIQQSWPNIHGWGEGRCIDNVWNVQRSYMTYDMINNTWYMIYDKWYMIYDIFMCMNLSRMVIPDVYSLEWIQEEEIWGKCQGQPLRLPMSKNLLQNKHTVNKSLSPHSTFSVPQLKKECLLRFHLLWLHLWRWLNRLGLYALEAIRDRTRRSDAVQMSTLSFLRNCLLHEHRIKETCDILHHGRLTFEGLIWPFASQS